MQVLTAEQAGKLIKATEGERLHALIVMALTTGMRQGELFGLQWDDIDLETGQVAVRRSVTTDEDGNLTFGPPKTKRGNRLIQIPPIALEAVRAHQVRMMREGLAGQALVFCDAKGGILRRQNVVRRFYNPALKRAEVPMVRFHELRHTAATLLLRNRVAVHSVSGQIGHSKASTTLDIYSHFIPADSGEVANTFDRLLKPA